MVADAIIIFFTNLVIGLTALDPFTFTIPDFMPTIINFVNPLLSYLNIFLPVSLMLDLILYVIEIKLAILVVRGIFFGLHLITGR